jgi:hypothetical protein
MLTTFSWLYALNNCVCFRVDKEQLLPEEEDDDLKEVTDLRKIAAQLLKQEQKNRYSFQ